LVQIARALEYCHRREIIHRDIKLENVMFGKDNQLKLIDFGLSANSFTDLSLKDEIVGTPYYVSPEMSEGRGQATQKTDVWSLGVLLYFLLTNEFPFNGKTI